MPGGYPTMFGSGVVSCSLGEIKRIYPNQWVAIAITETDEDGFAAAGEVITHDPDERFVWSAIHLGDMDDPVYVFYTGSRRTAGV